MEACTGARCDFALDYEIGLAPVMRDIEWRVRGSDYGATSWATREQARQSVARLGLCPGMRLLDIGAGSGWPALFLATLAGCDVVLIDVPLSGLRLAAARAASDGIAGRCTVLAADGAKLPFADAVFDRIHHADVLCCTERKFDLLNECRRVAREHARMEFSAISLARAPSGEDEHRLLAQSGPPHPDAGGDYATLLAMTGWGVAERTDVTPEFARCMSVLLALMQERRTDLIGLFGEPDYAARLSNRLATQTAIRRGLLKREIFVANGAR
jgi:SAM-dependent methyltransferase